MHPLRFTLAPFPAEGKRPGFAIAGAALRQANRVSVAFAIRGNIAALAVPSPEASPGRKDRLWEETCLEIFLAASDSAVYREFNLSPSGHWNVYRFDSYREGMREEPAFASLPFRVRERPEILELSVDLDVETILPKGVAVDLAVCAVLRTIGGEASHWALSHAGSRPDFHRRDGFLLNLPGE